MPDITTMAAECVAAGDLLDLTPLMALDMPASEQRHGRPGRRHTCLPRVNGVEATDREFLGYIAGRMDAAS
jgi:hypothetical protein